MQHFRNILANQGQSAKHYVSALALRETERKIGRNYVAYPDEDSYDPSFRVLLSEVIRTSDIPVKVKEKALLDIDFGKPVVYKGKLVKGDGSIYSPKDETKMFVGTMRELTYNGFDPIQSTIMLPFTHGNCKCFAQL
jgi:CRISPR/Cas system-associated protein Cas7 (RAMP superfamily)